MTDFNLDAIPKNVLNGCFEESTQLTSERIEYLQTNAMDYGLIGADDDPKGFIVQENDAELQKHIDKRIRYFQSRYDAISPDHIFGWKDWNQRSNGSCTSMGGTHAAQATQGYNYIYGTPLTFEPFNPLYLYMRGKNFRYSDGENLWTFAKNMVELGNSPVRLAGDDCVSRNITKAMWEKTNASEYQTTIVSLTSRSNLVRCLQAGFGVMFGSSYIPTSIDANGNVTKATSGSHCMALIGWDFKREMPYCQNSWGNVYVNGKSGGFVNQRYIDQFNMFGKLGNPIAMIATEYKLLLRKS